MAVFCTKKPLPTVIVSPDQKVFHPQFSHAFTPFRHITATVTLFTCVSERSLPLLHSLALFNTFHFVQFTTKKKKIQIYFHCFYVLYSVHFNRINCTFMTPTSASLIQTTAILYRSYMFRRHAILRQLFAKI